MGSKADHKKNKKTFEKSKNIIKSDDAFEQAVLALGGTKGDIKYLKDIDDDNEEEDLQTTATKDEVIWELMRNDLC